MMDTYELNKIVGAVLATALFIMGMQTLAGIVYTGNKPEQLAYSVEVEEDSPETAEDGGAGEKEVPIGALLAEADADKGATVIKKCAQCHTWDQGGANKIGPNLYNVVGRKIASDSGFGYSDALREKAGEDPGSWTYEALDAFIQSPKSFAKGTKMVFPGLKRGSQRADLILYLRGQSDSPPALPEVEPAEQSENQTGEQPADKSQDQAQEEPSEQSQDQAQEQPAEQSQDQAQEQPADKPEDQTETPPAEQPQGQAQETPAEQPQDQAEDKPQEQDDRAPQE